MEFDSRRYRWVMYWPMPPVRTKSARMDTALGQTLKEARAEAMRMDNYMNPYLPALQRFGQWEN